MHAPQVPPTVRTDYRPDIDGLRAVAVLSVLAYHYGAPLPKWLRLPGGFIGVDVFFVISGFLITSKLSDDIRGGTFSVLAFYDRRIRRILPALIVMLAITLFASRFLLMPGDYKALADSTATAAFGVSNFFFLANTGYFDQAADLMPLLHTWSLAVEEQFYVVWPLFLFVIAAGRHRIDVAAIIGGIVILGFGASLVWFDLDPKSAFFMALPRAWELAIGAALVFLPPLPRFAGETATALGIVLIGAAFLFVTAASFPGVAALFPCLGAALVIWPRRDSTTAASWLGHLSPIGLISYSLYLWHWPVWVLFRIYINNGTPRIREAAALALVSIALATLSWRFVERPFRKRRWQPGQTVWAALTACMLIFCCATYIDSADGLPQRLSGAYAMRSRDVMFDWPCEKIPLSPGTPAYCTFGAPWSAGTEKAILWGDSNAEHFAPILEDSATRANISVALYIRCAAFINSISGYSEGQPLGEPVKSYNQACSDKYDALFALLQNDPSIRTVILAASWNVIGVISSRQGDNLSGVPLFEHSIETTVRRLTALGRKVVIVATIPHWSHDPVPCAIQTADLLRRPCDDNQRLLKREFYQRINSDTLTIFRRITSKFPFITLIEPGAVLCKDENCVTSIAGEFIYYDGAHFRRNLSRITDHDLARLTGLEGIFD
jgi:peptidoglycan/LPS O-acetylase OafA/YrhL